MHWRRKWQPTPVFLPGESQGRGSLVGYRLWGHTESDTTEVTQQQQQLVSANPKLLTYPSRLPLANHTGFLSVSLSVSQVHLRHGLDSTYKRHHLMFVFLCLTNFPYYDQVEV